MRTVYTTTDTVEASMVEVALRDADLDFILENENAAWLAIGMPSPAAPIIICVADRDFDAAVGAIKVALTRMAKNRKAAATVSRNTAARRPSKKKKS